MREQVGMTAAAAAAAAAVWQTHAAFANLSDAFVAVDVRVGERDGNHFAFLDAAISVAVVIYDNGCGIGSSSSSSSHGVHTAEKSTLSTRGKNATRRFDLVR
jgi:hypothetical protein